MGCFHITIVLCVLTELILPPPPQLSYDLTWQKLKEKFSHCGECVCLGECGCLCECARGCTCVYTNVSAFQILLNMM